MRAIIIFGLLLAAGYVITTLVYGLDDGNITPGVAALLGSIVTALGGAITIAVKGMFPDKDD